MRLLGALVRWSPLFLLACAPAVMGQETPETPDPAQTPAEQTQPADEPAPDAPDDAAAEPAEPEPKQKMPFGLYIEAGSGAYEPDPIDSSIETLSTHLADNQFTMSEQDFARVAVGWKLPRGRGEFRLIFNGYSEDGYRLESTGRLSAIDPDLNFDNSKVLTPLYWWSVVAEDGAVTTVREPPVWELDLDDANGNGLVDDGEQRYVGADLDYQTTTYASMQNRAQTYDLVFGNVWGPPRFQGRWFGGFRYFSYEGNIPAGAWLYTPPDGGGYTDGALLELLNFRQETRGLGPTGLLEARFNFFNQLLQLYINGQASFVVMDIQVDSGQFATLIESEGQVIPVSARLTDEQTKSTWHTGAEAGVRLRLKSGLTLEASYGVVGLLDAILLPTEIRVPQNLQESEQGSSAIYNTQDYVLQGWRAGVSFQF